MPGDLAGHSFIRPESLVLCLSLILDPPEGSPTEPWAVEASNDFKHCNLTRAILFNIIQLFSQS